MTELFSLIGQVFSFIGTRILTLQIAGLSLWSWITALLIITIVIKFIFDNAELATIPHKKNTDKDEEKTKEKKIKPTKYGKRTGNISGQR